MSKKLLVTDSKGERELLLVGTMTVGRDTSCDISYDDPLLSRRHAEFVVSSDAVIVRDLASRNGILVNGVKVGEARLMGSDLVQIAHLRIRYVDDKATTTIAPEADGGDDKTVVYARPPVSPNAAAAAQVSPRQTAPMSPVDPVDPLDPLDPLDDDKTRMIPRPIFTPAAKPAQPPKMTASPPAAPADPAGDVQIRPAPTPAHSPAPAARPAPRAGRSPTGEVQPAAVAPSVEAERKARTARTSWAGRVLIQIMGLAAVVFVIAAVPMSVFQNRLLDATAMSRAVALVNWLAADAAAAIQVDGSAVNAADEVSREAGVVTALVLTPEGRVIAPASRSTETITAIPGIGVPPSEILRPRSGWNGDLVEVARPIRTKDRPRAAVAWITFRPSAPPEAGGSAILLGAAVFFSLLAGLVVATMLRRMTLKAMTVLNEDIELAVGGQLQEVGDPLGAKPVKELADSVNYLVARLKAGGGDPAAGARSPLRTAASAATPVAPVAPRHSDIRPVAQRPAPVARATPAAPAPASAHSIFNFNGAGPDPREGAPSDAARSFAGLPSDDARIVANSKFRVTEASAGCAEMLGVRPDKLVGAHLVDAIPDKQLVDAVLKCLSALPGGGEEKSVVSPAGRPYRVAVSVSRAAKDQPITIVMSPVGG